MTCNFLRDLIGFCAGNCQQFVTKSLFMMTYLKTSFEIVLLSEVREEEHISTYKGINEIDGNCVANDDLTEFPGSCP